ncbi:uncharacterized protein LOC131215998 [Anopheles bellator]|uniref:uncharacterized protein LOC131215998 n=1 Tax=Anopheles bellator TaxID=139047 RepID=UPI002647B457|nr:uncharacterized protein LOC131215998 [Anopheles bellator]
MGQSSVRCWIGVTIAMLVGVHFVEGRTHHHHHLNLEEPLRYSYGIYTPMGWTVSLYIWYMVKLGLILGVLLVLLFAKKWGNGREAIAVEGGPQYYHHRSLDSNEYSLLKVASRREATLFWKDRIEAIREKIKR